MIMDDIPFETARRAYSAASMDPERRATQVRRDYAQHLQAVRDEFEPLADTDEKKALLDDEMERYRQGYRKRELAILGAVSRTASPMVTGPSSFPVVRNRKAMDREHRLYEEMKEWQDKARRAIRRKLGPTALPYEEQLAKAETVQKQMKAANRIIRKDIGDEAKMAALVEIGISEGKAKLLIEPDFAKRVGYAAYELTSINSKIKRLRRNIEAEKASAGQVTTETPFEGGRVVDNVEADRIQIFYDEKPNPVTIKLLKSKGMHWAPSIGAWQRKRTANARYAIGQIVDAQ